MKNIIKAISVLASFVLLTGCGALNDASQTAESNAPQSETSAAAETDKPEADTESEDSAESEAANTENAAPEKSELNLGYLNSTAHLLAFVAAEEGYFAE